MEWCTMLFNKVLENFAVYLGQCDVFACNLITKLLCTVGFTHPNRCQVTNYVQMMCSIVLYSMITIIVLFLVKRFQQT